MEMEMELESPPTQEPPADPPRPRNPSPPAHHAAPPPPEQSSGFRSTFSEVQVDTAPVSIIDKLTDVPPAEDPAPVLDVPKKKKKKKKKKPAFHPFAMMQLPLNDDEPEEKKQPAPKKDPPASKIPEHEPVKPTAEVAGPSFQPVEEPAPQSESTNISMKPTAFGLGGPKKLPSAPSSIFELTEEQSKRPSFVPRSLTTAPPEPAKNIPSKSAAMDEKPTDEPMNKGKNDKSLFR